MKVACTLLPYIDFRYGVLPLREEGRITRLRRGVVCSEVAARKEGAAGTNPSRLEKQGSQKRLHSKIFWEEERQRNDVQCADRHIAIREVCRDETGLYKHTLF